MQYPCWRKQLEPVTDTYALAPKVIYKNVQEVIGKKQKQPNSPSTHNGLNKLWQLHPIKFYTVRKENK